MNKLLLAAAAVAGILVSGSVRAAERCTSQSIAAFIPAISRRPARGQDHRRSPRYQTPQLTGPLDQSALPPPAFEVLGHLRGVDCRT
jgi:hypothetical protein